MFTHLDIQQAGAQHLERAVLIFVLAAFILTFDNHTCRQMRHPNGRRRLVDMLTACAAGTEHVDLQIPRVKLKLDFLGLRQNRDRHRRRVDAPLRFRLRHTLDTMHAAFIFQARISALARDGKTDLLIAAKLRLVGADHLALPAKPFGIHCVHPVQHAGKKRRLLAARAAADFNNDVFIIVGIARKQQNFQFLRRLIEDSPVFVELLLRQLAHLAVNAAFIEHLARFVARVLCSAVSAVLFDDRRQAAVFLHQRRVLLRIAGHIRFHQAAADLLVARRDRIELIKHIDFLLSRLQKILRRQNARFYSLSGSPVSTDGALQAGCGQVPHRRA